MSITSLCIATRQSNMALWQASFIKQQLLKLYPHLQIELLGITTKGDQIQNKPLADIGGKGLFIKVLEEALLDGRADIAVHSMKDVPPELPESLEIVVILKRDNPHDVFVSNQYANIDELPDGAIIGTCSVRRQAQILAYNPKLTIKSLRGNVNTRLAKLDAGEYDGIILAAAGLERLALTNRICQVLDIEMMLPSVAQGALGIEVLQNKPELTALLAPLTNEESSICVHAERALVRALNGNCHSSIGAYATIEDEKITLRGLVASPGGQKVLKVESKGKIELADDIALSCAEELIAKGALGVLQIN